MLTSNKLNYRFVDVLELLKQQREQTHPKQFPNTTLNTLPQTLNQYSIYATESGHYPRGNNC